MILTIILVLFVIRPVGIMIAPTMNEIFTKQPDQKIRHERIYDR